jgi:NADPH:quinone reductase-like Zn-dependent oxidoreductase
VWVGECGSFGAQSYRPFGTAAQLTVVPDHLAVDLPGDVGDDVAACLGIPGITAHRAVFGDGPVAGATLLVHGVLGGVGTLAAQLGRWAGATVIGTVRHTTDLTSVDPAMVGHVVALDQRDPVAAIRAHAPVSIGSSTLRSPTTSTWTPRRQAGSGHRRRPRAGRRWTSSTRPRLHRGLT